MLVRETEWNAIWSTGSNIYCIFRGQTVEEVGTTTNLRIYSQIGSEPLEFLSFLRAGWRNKTNHNSGDEESPPSHVLPFYLDFLRVRQEIEASGEDFLRHRKIHIFGKNVAIMQLKKNGTPNFHEYLAMNRNSIFRNVSRKIITTEKSIGAIRSSVSKMDRSGCEPRFRQWNINPMHKR